MWNDEEYQREQHELELYRQQLSDEAELQAQLEMIEYEYNQENAMNWVMVGEKLINLDNVACVYLEISDDEPSVNVDFIAPIYGESLACLEFRNDDYPAAKRFYDVFAKRITQWSENYNIEPTPDEDKQDDTIPF